jgi:hypothetical protein
MPAQRSALEFSDRLNRLAGQRSDRAGDMFPRRWKHFAGKDARGVQHLLMRQIAEGKLGDEITRARRAGHVSHTLADRAGRACERAAIPDHGFKIFRNPGIARLRAVLFPELHEACIKRRPGAAAELHRFAIGVGRDHEAVDAEQGDSIGRVARSRPFGAIAIGDLANFWQRPGAN